METLNKTKNKKTVYLIGLIILVGILLVGNLYFFLPNSKETIELGSILSLTGAASSWGEAAQNGINLAVKDVNDNGGVLGKELRVIYEDDQSSPTKTVTSFKKLTEVNEIQFIIGPSWTKFGLAIKELVNNEVVVSPSLGGKDFNEGNEYAFNTRQHDYILSKSLAEYVYSKGYRTVAVLSVNDPYNKEQADEFKRVFKNLGGIVKYVFEPTIEQTDVRTDLLKVKSDSTIEALVATTGATPLTSLFAIQLRELNMKYPVYSVTIDQTRIDESKGAIDGWEYLSSFTPSDEFVERYFQTYRSQVHISADSAYDTVIMIVQAIEETESTNPKVIQEYLNNLKGFSGVSGDLVADGEGGFTKNYKILRVENSKPFELE
jgi:branched-chain amino acid transport system substrate-binding protein